MNNSFSGYIIGYEGLSHIFNSTPNALRAQKTRGRFTLMPVESVGKTLLFDRQAALDYLPVYQAQHGKRAKS